MGHSTHELIAGINRVGNAHAAQMAGEEDRQGAVHFCQWLSESGQNDMDKMLRMARDMDIGTSDIVTGKPVNASVGHAASDHRHLPLAKSQWILNYRHFFTENLNRLFFRQQLITAQWRYR